MDKSRIDCHVRPLIGQRKVSSLRLTDIEILQRDIAQGKTTPKAKKVGRGGHARGGKTVAARTVGMMGTILEYARRHGIISENVARGVRKFPSKKRTRFLSHEEYAALGGTDVASDPKIGISGVLESINTALKKYVPKEWGANPRLKVSALTRDNLRKVITAFIATGDGSHSAPYFRQGTGTLNMLVLAMLTQIAADKQNVIFAMEEPETAIPPYAQKRIVHGVQELATQTIFTSHSPYVLEEFEMDQTLVLSRDSIGKLSQAKVTLPASVKQKRYRQEFRTRFCEGLLARRILLAEGATEASTIPAAARRLSEIAPAKFSTLEQLGICTIDAGGDGQIADLGKLYGALGKTVYAACDKQDAASEAAIAASVATLFMHDESDIEKLVLKHATQARLEAFRLQITWPPHLQAKYPDPKVNVRDALKEYFDWSKGFGGLADFVSTCDEADIAPWIKDLCSKLTEECSMPPAAASKTA